MPDGWKNSARNLLAGGTLKEFREFRLVPPGMGWESVGPELPGRGSRLSHEVGQLVFGDLTHEARGRYAFATIVVGPIV
jgi:hypothetical protein